MSSLKRVHSSAAVVIFTGRTDDEDCSDCTSAVLVLTVLAAAMNAADRLKRAADVTSGLGNSGKDFLPRDCFELYKSGAQVNGVYKIYPDPSNLLSVKVYCDQLTDGGGWTVFQRRQDGSVDFYQMWKKYELGFGLPRAEFWLGNKYLHQLTRNGNNQLRVDMTTFSGKTAFAAYNNFTVAGEAKSYELTKLGTFYGSSAVADSLRPAESAVFQTYDHYQHYGDNVNWGERHHTGMWIDYYFTANPNGQYYMNGKATIGKTSIFWTSVAEPTESLRMVEMKVRPRDTFYP